jgi:hypothetical protein
MKSRLKNYLRKEGYSQKKYDAKKGTLQNHV